MKERMKEFHSYDSKNILTLLSNTNNYTIKNGENYSLYKEANGRLGPKVVLLDPNSKGGVVEIQNEGLTAESHSNFGSIRANVCVFKGKWMYEVLLGTAGIQQIGWATLDCPFTNEEGVGDSNDSYAYDGKRVKKWNHSFLNYGQPWAVGDIIGCCFDVDKGEISYYRNGISMGVAFKGIKIGENAYFPAVSLSYGERCTFNFGSKPFAYPIENFLPLQAPPPYIYQAFYLMECFNRLLPYAISNLINNQVIKF